MSKKVNKRSTLQKTFLETALRDSDSPSSVSDILKLAKESGVSVGRVTVFRYLKNCLKAAKVRKVQGLKGEILYEWVGSNDGHQHHFFCRECEGAFPIDGCGLKLAGFDLPEGFSVERHEIQLIGLCDGCQAA